MQIRLRSLSPTPDVGRELLGFIWAIAVSIEAQHDEENADHRKAA